MTANDNSEDIDHERRQLLGAATTGLVAAGAASLLSSQASAAPASDAIRPFSFKAPKKDLDDLRHRVAATRWPDKETVADDSQGVRLATMQTLARYWATDYDWRKCEARLNALPQFVTSDRRARHSFHPRALETRQGLADDRHARLARLDHRAAQDHRAAHRSDRAWRQRIGCLPSRHPVAARLRLLRQADEARMESGHHRQGMGDADAAPRLHELRGAGRRLGQCHLGSDGPAAAAGIARHSHQHGGHGSTRCFEGAVRRRPAAGRPLAGRKARVGSARRFLQERAGLRHRDVATSADALRDSPIRRSVSRPGCSITTFAATR